MSFECTGKERNQITGTSKLTIRHQTGWARGKITVFGDRNILAALKKNPNTNQWHHQPTCTVKELKYHKPLPEEDIESRYVEAIPKDAKKKIC